jgi:hypothetical protein
MDENLGNLRARLHRMVLEGSSVHFKFTEFNLLDGLLGELN